MPQMMPLMWLKIYFYSIFFLLILLTKTFFMFTFNLNFKNFTTQLTKWMWKW